MKTWGSFNDNLAMDVVYFNQLLGAAHTQKLVELLFQTFSTFFIVTPWGVNPLLPVNQL